MSIYDPRPGEVFDEKDYNSTLHSKVAADRKMSVMEEASSANSKAIEEQSDLLYQLTDRLRPIINDNRDDGATTADSAEKGMFSEVTNTLMEHGDRISANNRRLRQLLKTLEI